MPSASSSTVDANNGQELHIVEWHHMNLWKYYPLAFGASWSVRCLTYPLNLVKTRLQLQKQNQVYRGMRHAFVDIFRTEGPTSLYRGFWISLPQIVGTFVYTSIYEKSRSLLHLNTNIQSDWVISGMAAAPATFVTQIWMVPTDVISQHLMIYNNPARFTADSKVIAWLQADQQRRRAAAQAVGYKKRFLDRFLSPHVMRAIYVVDGLKGFYRGFTPTLLFYIPNNVCFWICYYNLLNVFKAGQFKWLMTTRSEKKRREEKEDGKETTLKSLLVVQTMSAALSGVMAACLTNPLEMLRIRIQVQRTGFWETVRRLYREERLQVFYKGLSPRITIISIQSCVMMTLYEAFKRFCVLPQYKDDIVW